MLGDDWTSRVLIFTSILATVALDHPRVSSEPVIFTDQWAVHVPGGDRLADEIATKHGFTNLGKIFDDYYHFRHRKVLKRSIQSSSHHHSLLTSEAEVRWAQQQVVKRRTKRDGLLEVSNAGVSPRTTRSINYNLNDPGWIHMWYLNRGNGLDMNVQEAWKEGVTGKGTVVTILDDGLEKDHPDIIRNYDAMASYDINDGDEDPSPRYDATDSNRHGTRCAGEVAAQGNNSICAVGIAFDANIGGVRMLDGDVTDAVEARSLSHNSQHIDIYSASWGPDDDGKTVDGPGELATRAFLDGIRKGRGGKGSIFVWASGNGGREHDNCNCDGYTNSIWTLSISSATENGSVPWYSEACSSTLATAYSSGAINEKQIVTTDLHHSCTPSHTGTSAAAPLAAGICALVLEANRNLTWRDMQHIVVRTAKRGHLIANDWQINGVGRNVSHSFGYGLMDAGAMVRLARQWITVPPQQFCEIRAPDVNKIVSPKNSIQLQLFVRECGNVNVLEHVQVLLSLSATNRGDIEIYLSSPSGTRSTLLQRRPLDNSRNGFHSWPFMSIHFWGESPFGAWTIEVQNEGRFPATLNGWTLIAYGTKDPPGIESPSPKIVSAPLQSSASKLVLKDDHPEKSHSLSSQVNAEKNREAELPQALPLKTTSNFDVAVCEAGFYMWEGKCMAVCPNASYPINHTGFNGFLNGICAPCHYSCLYCSGPSDSQCTSCYPDSQLKSISVPGSLLEPESHCFPNELVRQLEGYENWSTGVELALAINLALVIALVCYTMCTKKSCNSSYLLKCCRRSNETEASQRHGDYSLLTTANINLPPPIIAETIRPECSGESSKPGSDAKGV
ncbi:Amontillado [Daphnia magna]|uniref:furin n=1 Tax=Daphnia magna TaxID=35525 RepID=A0A164N7H8_9CRUS|nr:Amontillado [Daphnia magna]